MRPIDELYLQVAADEQAKTEATEVQDQVEWGPVSGVPIWQCRIMQILAEEDW